MNPTQPLTTEQKELLILTWKRTYPYQRAFARIFYSQLLELAPHLQALFSQRNIVKQGLTFTRMIEIAVDNINVLEKVASHPFTADPHNPTSQALLTSVAKILNTDFTPEVKEAWLIFATLLSTPRKNVLYDGVPFSVGLGTSSRYPKPRKIIQFPNSTETALNNPRASRFPDTKSLHFNDPPHSPAISRMNPLSQFHHLQPCHFSEKSE